MHGDFPTLGFDYKCMFCVQCTAYIQQKRTEACGGGRQQPVPGHWWASLVNRHPQMRRTPGYPESMHCYEPFCTVSAPHAAAVVRPRRRPPQKPRNRHRTPHPPKRRSMSDPELREDTASPSPPRARQRNEHACRRRWKGARPTYAFSPGSGERQGWRGGKGHDGHTGMIYNRSQVEVRKPKCQRTEG